MCVLCHPFSLYCHEIRKGYCGECNFLCPLSTQFNASCFLPCIKAASFVLRNFRRTPCFRVTIPSLHVFRLCGLLVCSLNHSREFCTKSSQSFMFLDFHLSPSGMKLTIKLDILTHNSAPSLILLVAVSYTHLTLPTKRIV